MKQIRRGDHKYSTLLPMQKEADVEKLAIICDKGNLIITIIRAVKLHIGSIQNLTGCHKCNKGLNN